MTDSLIHEIYIIYVYYIHCFFVLTNFLSLLQAHFFHQILLDTEKKVYIVKAFQAKSLNTGLAAFYLMHANDLPCTQVKGRIALQSHEQLSGIASSRCFANYPDWKVHQYETKKLKNPGISKFFSNNLRRLSRCLNFFNLKLFAVLV